MSADRGSWWNRSSNHTVRGGRDALSIALATMAAVAALTGLFADGLYASGRRGTGAAATAAMLRGFDLVTLAVVVPALSWACAGSSRATMPARFIVAVCMAYLGYTYAYYVFGNGFTDLLLLHVAVLAGSVTALGRVLLGLRSGATFSLGRRAARGAAATLAILAAALGGMWIAVCLAYIATGRLPAGSELVETDQVVQLGIVLDLAILVPLYAAAAVQLWRGRWWGLVLATLALVAGILHQLSYLVALLFQDLSGVPGAVPFDPLEPVIVGIYLTGALLLVIAIRHRHEPGDAAHPMRRGARWGVQRASTTVASSCSRPA